MGRQANPTADRLKQAIDRYFDHCDAEGKRYTLPGLCCHLGVTPGILERWERDQESKSAKRALLVTGALLRIRDALEQRTDPMATLLVRQGPPSGLGGGSGGSGGEDGPITVRVLFGEADCASLFE